MSIGERFEIEEKIRIAMGRLRRAIELHKPICVIGLFSGGHDSFSACYILGELRGWVECMNINLEWSHINTGMGIEETRNYVRRTCKTRDWYLHEMKAAENQNAKGQPDPQIYEELVKAYGFPGPGHHGKMYNRLKERALRMLERYHGANCRGKNKKRVMYVSGCRTQESTRRMANTKEVQIDGRRIWCAPLHDWSKIDTSNLLERANQPRNIVVDLIHKSGECLCGAFKDQNSNELAELAMFPETRPAYEEIMRLNAIVRPIHGWGWGEKPPTKPKPSKLAPGQLCWSCMK